MINFGIKGSSLADINTHFHISGAFLWNSVHHSLEKYKAQNTLICAFDGKPNTSYGIQHYSQRFYYFYTAQKNYSLSTALQNNLSHLANRLTINYQWKRPTEIQWIRTSFLYSDPTPKYMTNKFYLSRSIFYLKPWVFVFISTCIPEDRDAKRNVCAQHTSLRLLVINH
jgi:hypothetical protein